jgi:hypothetical protein
MRNALELIVLAVMCLAILAIILVSVWTYESVSNPQIAQDSGQVCAFVPDNSGQVQEGISGPVVNVTGRIIVPATPN